MQYLTIMDDGIELRAILERPHSGSCPLVIVLHGFTSSKDRDHTVAACRAMRQAGCATLRFDLYGHGESGGEFRNHTLHKWISNTLAVLGYARSLDFVTDIYLSGHSQGGLVAALVGGMAPDLIRGLILRAPAFMIPRCAREGSLLGFSFDPARIPDEIQVIKGLTLGGNYLRVAQTINTDDAIGRFPGPVLILHGDADDVVPPEDSRAAAGQYRHCGLALLPGETHHFDQAPEQMEAIIRAWLKKEAFAARKTVIETERLILREYTEDDFEALYQMLSDPETMAHYPSPYDENGTKRWIRWNLDNYARYGFGLWAAEWKETGEFAGDCGLTMHMIDGETLPEIGYHIRKEYWRRGLAREAAGAVRDWAFRNTKFDALYSYMNAANEGSWRTAMANGMKKAKEYRDPKAILFYVFAITREEWKALKAGE